MVYRLKSADGQTLEVDQPVAAQFVSLYRLMEVNADDEIPNTNVHSEVLAMVFTYCQRHADANANEEDLKAFDDGFVRVDQSTLYDIMLAADELGVKSLLDLTTTTVADMMKGKTPEELRQTLLID